MSETAAWPKEYSKNSSSNETTVDDIDTYHSWLVFFGFFGQVAYQQGKKISLIRVPPEIYAVLMTNSSTWSHGTTTTKFKGIAVEIGNSGSDIEFELTPLYE